MCCRTAAASTSGLARRSASTRCGRCARQPSPVLLRRDSDEIRRQRFAQTSQGNEKSAEQEEEYKLAIEEVRNTIPPAEIVGKAGDVCFWVCSPLRL